LDGVLNVIVDVKNVQEEEINALNVKEMHMSTKTAIVSLTVKSSLLLNSMKIMTHLE